jgi:two-component system, OmpR family, KDP operon response regulator KdpE
MQALQTLLIGDQPAILRTLRRNLAGRGYDVSIALDDRDVFEAIKALNFDLFILLLDFATIEVDGLAICRQIRESTQAPLIVLSAIGAEQTKIKAFDFGADDYVEMPFSMEEFLARVRSSLRRWSMQRTDGVPTKNLVISNDLYIDGDSHRVSLRGEEIRLTPTEFKLLHYLSQNRGKVISHRSILQAVWGAEYGNEREYLRVFISQLRHKIEDDPLRPTYILTEPGVGYRFV